MNSVSKYGKSVEDALQTSIPGSIYKVYMDETHPLGYGTNGVYYTNKQDLTLYEPTKKCLELIRPHLAKNSIVAFDELTLEEYPGETIALIEEWGLSDYEIIRNPISPHQSYLRF